MKQSPQIWQKILPLLFLLLAQVACQKDEEVQTASSGTTDNGTDTNFGDGNTTEPVNLAVQVVKPAGSTMILHPASDWTAPCQISLDAPSTDLYCFLEANEFDLYMLGAKLTYQIPSSICSYGRFIPYHYYQFPPGTGATSVTVTSTDGGAPVLLSSGASAGVTTTLFGMVPQCSVDYSPLGGPNCCEGTYNLLTVYVDTVTPLTTSTQTQGKWGGKASNCLTGPAVDSQAKDKDGYPLASVYYLYGKNLSKSYTLTAPNDKGFVTNVYLANYFSGDATYSLASAPLPMRGPNTTAYRAGQPLYELQCLDHNEDLVHRINILVRSWSKQSEFLAHGDPTAAGPQGIPFNFSDYFDRAGWPGTGTTPGYNTGWGNTYPRFSN